MQANSQNRNNHDADYVAGSFGGYLRDRRTARDIPLEEVSEATGISLTVLQALENEEKDKLPAEVYIKAFYKKYAQYLGENYDDIQEKYELKTQKLEKPENTSIFNTVITIKGQEENIVIEILRRLFLPVIIILAGLLIYWIYKNYLNSYLPFGFFRDHFPFLFAHIPGFPADLIC